MATTTATMTLSSSDILSQALSLSSTATLYKHNTTSTGLEQMNYHRANIPTGTNFVLISESAGLNSAAGEPANYVYICNKNTDVTHYVTVSIKDEVIGSLYAGDWMFIPWGMNDTASEFVIEAEPSGATCPYEFVLLQEPQTLVAHS